MANLKHCKLKCLIIEDLSIISYLKENRLRLVLAQENIQQIIFNYYIEHKKCILLVNYREKFYFIDLKPVYSYFSEPNPYVWDFVDEGADFLLINENNLMYEKIITLYFSLIT